MKKIFALIIAISMLQGVWAQKEGRFRTDLNLGYAIPVEGNGGVLFQVEPKYNIKNNMNVGLRIGAAYIKRDLDPALLAIGIAAPYSLGFSFLGTYNYHFNGGTKQLIPFVGAGMGLFLINKLGADLTVPVPVEGIIDANAKFGGMIRAGAEWKKFRFSLEYDFVPNSEISTANGPKIGEISNSYLGISVGYFFGGGNWRAPKPPVEKKEK